MYLVKYTDLTKVTALITLIFIGWACDSRGRQPSGIIEPVQLTELRGTLSVKPTIKSPSDGGSSVEFRLKEYPGFKFEVGEVRYTALNARAFTKKAEPRDSVILQISLYDRERIGVGPIPLRSNRVEFYSLRMEDQSYMTLEGGNKVWENEHELGGFLGYWFLGLALLVGIVYVIFELTGWKKKIKTWWADVEASRN